MHAQRWNWDHIRVRFLLALQLQLHGHEHIVHLLPAVQNQNPEHLHIWCCSWVLTMPKEYVNCKKGYLQNQISELLTVLWWLPEYILPTREMTKPSPLNMQTKKMPISNRAVQVVRSRKSGGGWGANHPNPDCTTGSRISGREEKGPGLLHALVNNNRISSSTNLSTTAVSHPPTSLRHSSSMVRIEDIRSTCQMLAWGWHLQRLTT